MTPQRYGTRRGLIVPCLLVTIVSTTTLLTTPADGEAQLPGTGRYVCCQNVPSYYNAILREVVLSCGAALATEEQVRSASRTLSGYFLEKPGVTEDAPEVEVKDKESRNGCGLKRRQKMLRLDLGNNVLIAKHEITGDDIFSAHSDKIRDGFAVNACGDISRIVQAVDASLNWIRTTCKKEPSRIVVVEAQPCCCDLAAPIPPLRPLRPPSPPVNISIGPRQVWIGTYAPTETVNWAASSISNSSSIILRPGSSDAATLELPVTIGPNGIGAGASGTFSPLAGKRMHDDLERQRERHAEEHARDVAALNGSGTVGALGRRVNASATALSVDGNSKEEQRTRLQAKEATVASKNDSTPIDSKIAKAGSSVNVQPGAGHGQRLDRYPHFDGFVRSIRMSLSGAQAPTETDLRLRVKSRAAVAVSFDLFNSQAAGAATQCGFDAAQKASRARDAFGAMWDDIQQWAADIAYAEQAQVSSNAEPSSSLQSNC